MRYQLRYFLLIPFVTVALAAFWWVKTNVADLEAMHKPRAKGPRGSFDPPVYKHTAIAVTTTIKRPSATLQTWLDYNLRRFDLVLVFMDDPAERPAFERFIGSRPVVLFNGSDVYASMSIPSRLMLRQSANNEAAIAYALKKNITWLIHLDPDELFYEEGDWDWDALENVGHISFVNHEAVPLTHRTANFFFECKLFKTNHGQLEFMAYGNGKSAVRVTPGVRPFGPHSWDGFQNESINVTRPMILHYPYPSFESWFGKFKSLGHFSDNWFDDPDSPNDMKFMLASRDIVQAAVTSGDMGPARKFFSAQIPDDEVLDRLLAEDTLRRISPLTARKSQ